MPDYDYSFSGIKTSILYFLQKQTQKDDDFISRNLADLAASIQYNIVAMLTEKLAKAANDLGIKEIALAGGVSANSGLRAAVQQLAGQYGWRTYFPALEYCTDNAAMIAMAGYYKYQKQEFCSLDVAPLARYAM